jgi:hypothetical protein
VSRTEKSPRREGGGEAGAIERLIFNGEGDTAWDEAPLKFEAASDRVEEGCFGLKNICFRPEEGCGFRFSLQYEEGSNDKTSSSSSRAGAFKLRSRLLASLYCDDNDMVLANVPNLKVVHSRSQ